jgi:hypothetical protein
MIPHNPLIAISDPNDDVDGQTAMISPSYSQPWNPIGYMTAHPTRQLCPNRESCTLPSLWIRGDRPNSSRDEPKPIPMATLWCLPHLLDILPDENRSDAIDTESGTLGLEGYILTALQPPHSFR